MKHIYISFLLTLLSGLLFGQYRFDNVKYKTVYYEDLCSTLKNNPGFLLLDVRSKGEYEDTSSFKSLNIGHFNNAVNIEVWELGKRLKEIDAYKNKPVFVYCSHSQRSRRASTMLADSGFSNVFNINGGLTSFRINDATAICNNLFIQSNLPFSYISPKRLSESINKANYYIIDLREDSAFKGISTDQHKNALGKFTTATNFPFKTLEKDINLIPRDKEILLVDESGNESVKAAELLSRNGYKHINVLFDGLDMWVTENPVSNRPGWINHSNFNLTNADGFVDLAKNSGKLTVLDVRTKEEFDNKAKETYKNIGRIKDAVNIPYNNLPNEFSELKASKDIPIVIYAFSSQQEAFNAAHVVASAGYKNVYVLMGGLFNVRWRAANIKGKGYLNQWVVNVPDNQ